MKKLKLRRAKPEAERPSRITNETVAEHREQILAGGRRFKYPRQYARHKLVFNAIIISLITLIILAVIVWQQLYIAQNTSEFFYRMTRILPVPVASVDGAQVRYSDYLLSLSGSEHYLQQSERLDLDSADGKRQVEYYKRQALDDAIANTYAAKLAAEKGITITDQQVKDTIQASRNTVTGKISQQVYDDSTFSIYGYTPDEYSDLIHQSLLQQEVAYAIDTKANTAKKEVETYLDAAKKPTLVGLAKQLQAKGYDAVLGSSSGMVPKTNHDYGLTQKALTLQKNKLSDVFRSTNGDGYYLVQLTDSNDTQLSYYFLRIPLTVFAQQLQTLQKNHQVKEYISVKQNSTAVIRR
jgi:hypothetical protein